MSLELPILAIKKLSPWQQQAFSAALVARMLPNYRLFSQACSWGEPAVLENQLDLIWQKLAARPIKINLENQLLKLEAETPDALEFDLFAVYPAIDVCSGLMLLLQSTQEKELRLGPQVAQLSAAGVAAYLDYAHKVNHGEEISEQELGDDPLMMWELESQQALIDALLDSAENPKTVNVVKELVQSQGMSNLGFENP